MCIIAIKPKGKKMFNDSVITIMFINNPDGAGYMFYDNTTKKVCIKKGFMTCKSLLSSLHSRDFTDTNVILHFRIGTSGLNDSLNCHPYPLYGKNATKCTADIAMAHNGVLTQYNPPKTSKINDTQMFINNVLNKLDKNFLYDDDKVMLIHDLIGTNRLAFLDSKNKITTIGDFIHDGGYIFSNRSYKYESLLPKKLPRGTTPIAKKTTVTKTSVCPKNFVSDTCVSTRYKLTDEEYDFWHDEPSDFWDDWDRRHPTIR